MISMLMGLGASSRLAKVIAYVAVPLIVLGLLWLALDSWGDKRYAQGEADTDAKWQLASEKLIEKSLKAGTKADTKAAARAADYAAKVEDEREKIDVAISEGRSGFDALFPVDNGM